MTLATQLEKIESSGLIRLAQDDPELAYIFRHALVQDATYESLLRADRRTLHRAVGRTLAALYADRLDEVASTLALHFEKAEEWGAAVDYYIRAGQAAARVYAVDEAIELFRRAVEISPPSISSENLTHLYSQYGRALELAGRFDAVIEVYEQMLAEGLKRNDLQIQLDALTSRAILHSTPSPYKNFALATQLCERALSIADSLAHQEARSRIYWILMIAMLFDGHIQEAVAYGEKSLEIARVIKNPERLAFTLNDIVRAYYSAGLKEKGHAANLEARALWHKLSNLPMLVDNLCTCAQYLFLAGQYHEAIEVGREAYEIGQSINNIWGKTFCLMILGFCYGELGEIEKAIETNLELLSFDSAQTFAIAQISSLGQLAAIYTGFGDFDTGYQYAQTAISKALGFETNIEAAVLAGLLHYKLAQGQLAEAETLLAKALERYDPENFTTFVPQYMESARNELLMYKGEFSAAVSALDEIISIMDRLGVVFCRPDFMLRKANGLMALKRWDDALEMLQQTIVLCEQLGTRLILWKVYSLMSEAHTQLNHLSAAEQSRNEAKEQIHFLRHHLPDGLHQSFLQLPTVVKLFEK